MSLSVSVSPPSSYARQKPFLAPPSRSWPPHTYYFVLHFLNSSQICPVFSISIATSLATSSGMHPVPFGQEASAWLPSTSNHVFPSPSSLHSRHKSLRSLLCTDSVSSLHRALVYALSSSLLSFWPPSSPHNSDSYLRIQFSGHFLCGVFSHLLHKS